jgi:hypothetical protein
MNAEFGVQSLENKSVLSLIPQSAFRVPHSHQLSGVEGSVPSLGPSGLDPSGLDPSGLGASGLGASALGAGVSFGGAFSGFFFTTSFVTSAFVSAFTDSAGGEEGPLRAVSFSFPSFASFVRVPALLDALA